MSKHINGAQIVSEFSQSKVLDVIKANLPMPKEHEALVKGGICYALSLEWLRCAIGKREDLICLLNLDDELKAKKEYDSNACAYYKQIANGFIAYSDTISRQFGVPAADLITGVETLPKGMTNLERDNYFAGLWSKDRILFDKAELTNDAVSFNAVLTGQSNRMFFLRLVLKNGGHRIAFTNKDSTLHLFDPNFGVYEVDDAKALFESLNSIYGIVSSYASSCPFI